MIFDFRARLPSYRRAALGKVDPVFLLRCIFWLSIVFSSMSWATDAAQPHAAPDVAREGKALVGAVGTLAADQVRAWCVKSPERCLADASRLTALVALNQAEDQSEMAASVAKGSSSPNASLLPVPPANPHRAAMPRS